MWNVENEYWFLLACRQYAELSNKYIKHFTLVQANMFILHIWTSIIVYIISGLYNNIYTDKMLLFVCKNIKCEKSIIICHIEFTNAAKTFWLKFSSTYLLHIDLITTVYVSPLF
jgi:hypothetical protein